MSTKGKSMFWYIAGLYIFLIGQDVPSTESAVAHSTTTTKCEFYNSTCRDQGVCPLVEECGPSLDGQQIHCYALWSIQNGTTNVSLKGCFVNGGDCVNQNKCVEKSHTPKNNLFYCCCEGDMCNANFSWEPQTTEAAPPSTAIPTHEASQYHFYYNILIVMGFGLVILVAGLIYYWTRRHKHYFNGLPTSEQHPLPPPSPILDQRPIQLIEIKARGRFGAVWKAKFKTEEVAVKIFPIQDKQSWFFCGYLKARTITWNELCLIAETISKGLMHLHEAIPGNIPGEKMKPAVAHRDFKSKNVLLKNDMTACIADFGLAIVFESGKSCGDTHGQVGTRR
ncbi:hypothetical protein JTB14_012777 [Gonioctena quinquepunctata]|nr:hypothetical protein JTB14_012777 [Gonioctena quinquepunctata]